MELNLGNPVFAAYAVAASILILKAAAMSWLTVVRMIGENGGFRNPEDLKRTPMNKAPNPDQLLPNPRVERIRRIQQNDLENLPFFLVAGLLYVTTSPSLLVAQWLFGLYVVSRLLHFAAYLSAQIHEVRATFWTIGSLILIYMAGRTLWAALGW
ncbi:MAPEG family protein [Sandaracinobacteroides hominis]|uniref:MAPEG family protein n=1 Tax=Sandaracinobacteroides hominis TaxID=2780086 RepID=UPI0018F2C589|nr:MAPEG family protein [Sandaracinobacteroides hominis]